jgi:hypothetical protein
MIEFNSTPQKKFRPVTLAITLGVLAILVGGVAFYVHYQHGLRPHPGAPLEPPGLVHAGNADFEYYKTRIRFESVTGAIQISLNGGKTATISGIIVNDGDRTLEALELRVTLRDEGGTVLKERTNAFALRPGTYNYKPLAALERRGFSVSIAGANDDWDPKQISLDITGLKYR